jgi:hypothetical protein
MFFRPLFTFALHSLIKLHALHVWSRSLFTVQHSSLTQSCLPALFFMSFPPVRIARLIYVYNLFWMTVSDVTFQFRLPLLYNPVCMPAHFPFCLFRLSCLLLLPVPFVFTACSVAAGHVSVAVCLLYCASTVKKRLVIFLSPAQLGCHLPNSSWRGII